MSVAFAGLVVGLGNPGPQYAQTRHNCGFLILDALRRHAPGACREVVLPVRGRFWRWEVPGSELPWGLLTPLTYMNRSGEAVAELCRTMDLGPEQVVVVHDELDLPFGTLRLKLGGGLAGHRGLQSIANCLQSRDFIRLRVGIGRPSEGFGVVDHVLSPFSPEELAQLDELCERGNSALQAYCTRGFESARDFCRPAE